MPDMATVRTQLSPEVLLHFEGQLGGLALRLRNSTVSAL